MDSDQKFVDSEYEYEEQENDGVKSKESSGYRKLRSRKRRKRKGHLIPLLPLTMILQITANYTFFPYSRFMDLYVQLYSFVNKIIILALNQMFSFFLMTALRRKTFKRIIFDYSYAYTLISTCCMLHYQWVIYKNIILGGDIEVNPGPGDVTFSFCSWNLNSICGHNFVRIPMIEAYYSVYNYNLMGIVETHLNSTVDTTKLEIHGYTFIKNNHPRDMKRGGVGLYINDECPAKPRWDLVTLPSAFYVRFN